MRKREYEDRIRRALDLTVEKKPFGLDEENAKRRAEGKAEKPWPPPLPEGIEAFFNEAHDTLKKTISRGGFTSEAQVLLFVMWQELKRLEAKLKATEGASSINALRKRLKAKGVGWKECQKMSKSQLEAALGEGFRETEVTE